MKKRSTSNTAGQKSIIIRLFEPMRRRNRRDLFFWHSDSLKYASSHLFHALGLLFIKKITGVRISLHFTGKEHVQPIKTKVIIFSLTRKKNELSFYTYACKYFKFFPVIRIHSCRSKESILLVNGNKFMNQYFFILIEKCEVQSL